MDEITSATKLLVANTVYFMPRSAGNSKGAQIDLLIDRADQIINIREMKFSTNEFRIEKKYAAELKNKLATFRRETGTRKQLQLTLVTTHGVVKNDRYHQLVDSEVKMEELLNSFEFVSIKNASASKSLVLLSWPT